MRHPGDRPLGDRLERPVFTHRASSRGPGEVDDLAACEVELQNATRLVVHLFHASIRQRGVPALEEVIT